MYSIQYNQSSKLIGKINGRNSKTNKIVHQSVAIDNNKYFQKITISKSKNRYFKNGEINNEH